MSTLKLTAGAIYCFIISSGMLVFTYVWAISINFPMFTIFPGVKVCFITAFKKFLWVFILPVSLSPYSKELRNDILDWLKVTHKNDIRKLAKNFQNIFESAGIDSLIDIKKKKRIIFDLIEESKNMDPEAKNVLINFMKIFIKSIGDTYITEMKTKIKDYVD